MPVTPRHWPPMSGAAPIELTQDLPQRQRPDIFSFNPPDETTPTDIQPRWRRNLFALLELPASSPSAFLVHVLMTALIFKTSVWFGLETSLVAMFTMEYIARCLAWSGTWMSLVRWMFSFFGIIDLLSVAPYYIELILLQDTSVFFRFSILRMFRLLRVFRPFRSNNTVLLCVAFPHSSFPLATKIASQNHRSHHALFALGFFVVMVLTVFSTLLGTWDDILETFINTDGDPSQFASIPAAAWFVLVTITTVGYGEITPRSFLGRLVTLPLLVFGLLLIALPSFVLGREFSMSPHSEPTSPTVSSSFMPRSRDPFVPQSGLGADLSNRKLAHNQTELSNQITELRNVVEAQGHLISRLVAALEGKGKARARDVE
ncbi:hypothetical protein C8F01DRAFT_1099454 [Mycena amicta]|nr:hypothetical protein C8F01DRAFT_1099454 [Mycena amicta]